MLVLAGFEMEKEPELQTLTVILLTGKYRIRLTDLIGQTVVVFFFFLFSRTPYIPTQCYNTLLS